MNAPDNPAILETKLRFLAYGYNAAMQAYLFARVTGRYPSGTGNWPPIGTDWMKR